MPEVFLLMRFPRLRRGSFIIGFLGGLLYREYEILFPAYFTTLPKLKIG